MRTVVGFFMSLMSLFLAPILFEWDPMFGGMIASFVMILGWLIGSDLVKLAVNDKPYGGNRGIPTGQNRD